MLYFLYRLDNFLLYLFVLPIIGSLLLLLSFHQSNKRSLLIALNTSFIAFIISLILWALFNQSTSDFQFVTNNVLWINQFNLNFSLGIDGISLFFVILTTLLIPLCILSSWNNVSFNVKEFLIAFLILEFFLIGAFCSIDLLFFYIFFESVLIPMFLIIGIWGSRDRKVLASYYFFIYTLLGSVIALLAIVYIFLQVGSTEYNILLTFNFTIEEQKFLWLAFFLAFASKVPMIPVHLWLPEAHVEAPTAGSVVLAGILLKLGIYGFLRFSLPLYPKASCFFIPLVYAIGVLGIVFASFSSIRQSDFKRIIAYTSIAHMNLVLLGVFSFSNVGIEGSIIQSLSHGFVASALFFIIGIAYDRYQTRIVSYYGGLINTMPIYVTVFLFFTLANISFPGTSNFIGEFMILVGSFTINTVVTVLGATSVILCGAYSFWLFNRVSYGNLKNQYTKNFIDVSFREITIITPLIFGTLLIGVYPKIFLANISMTISSLVELLYF